MNGFADCHYQSDCPLTTCTWVSDPLPTESAAREARRKHLTTHTLGDLVDFIASAEHAITRYERTVPFAT